MSPVETTAGHWRRATLALTLAGLAAFALADLGITRGTPGAELQRLALGFVTPDFTATDALGDAVLQTLAFAFQGVALGAAGGFLLALVWHRPGVRLFAASIRAVHELFWGLIFLQITGLSPLTGVLAIGLPYAGIFAKVFGEFLEEADPGPADALPGGTGVLSTFFAARLPLVWSQFRAYGAYRLECALRAAAILGFIGLPTLGFHLETAFREGSYSAGAALLYVFFALIGTQRLWLHRRLVPLYLLAAVVLAPPVSAGPDGALKRFFTSDIVPAPLRDGGGWAELGAWLADLGASQALPGLWNTLVVAFAALLLTGVLALALFPLASPHFGHRPGRALSHFALVMVRTTPEFLLAFVFLMVLGPSMLPGILALALHTGVIVAYLTGRFSESIRPNRGYSQALTRYGYEILPRVYPNFLAFLLYRFEIIMRETAVLGLLGIPTLGFYIDSGFAEFRFDRALVLIIIAVLLNLAVDIFSRILRRRLRLQRPATAY
jgi:phosphonate transport system permease protein